MSSNKLPKLIRKRPRRLVIALMLLFVLLGIYWLESSHLTTDKSQPVKPSQSTAQANHRQVIATVFWVGEPAEPDNANITNVASSWTGDWVRAFGGVDTYNKRCGYNPCGFTPKENAFYFALPYNDRQDNGSLKPMNELKQIPWYSGAALEGESLLKNHWIAITYNGKTAYAQWEDVGPTNEDDINYVFGNQPPKFRSGLDVSPATNTFLNMQGEAKVSWRFVSASDVPDGPWKTTITTSQLDYN